ncbi:MAG: cyclase family protein [Nitrososphaerales archaeon]|nr:cyclase family protein [Nitrososphaerales archaeon]
MGEWFETSDWFPSKWGASDELGTLNTLTPEKLLSSLKIVKRGKVYSLGHLIHNEMPTRVSIHGPFSFFTSQRVYDHRPPLREPTSNKFGAALCRLETTDHLGTHLDSLNHVSQDNKFYNGVDAYQTTTPRGTLKLGMETSPPIVTRGVMVDAALIHGKDVLEEGYPVKPEEVERFLAERKLSVGSGDAFFVHTGVSKLWMDTAKYNGYFEASPGIGYELAKWLGRKDVSVAGADTPGTEVAPPEIKGTRLPVHQYLITKCGIRLIDNMKLDELARDRVYEFLFVCSPLPIKGATASPVAPVAIV